MGSEVKEKALTFDVQGEFITQWTREALYSGEKSFEKIMETLMLCMVNEDVPEAQTRRYAEDILLGRAALKGSTAAGTYHLEVYEPGEEEQLTGKMNIWKEIERRKKAEKNLQRMVERWDVAMNYIPEETKRTIRKELGEETAEDRQQDALDSFMTRMMDEEDHTTDDYGWLEPDGTFHAVEWGNHQEWANDYLDKNLKQEERFAAMLEINASGMTKSCSDVIGAADYLVRRGWVLLHNPSQGLAIPTRDTTKAYTKAQKEFLYDYYMERDCKKEANEVWEE